jgi:hypothetical protein
LNYIAPSSSLYIGLHVTAEENVQMKTVNHAGEEGYIPKYILVDNQGTLELIYRVVFRHLDSKVNRFHIMYHNWQQYVQGI